MLSQISFNKSRQFALIKFLTLKNHSATCLCSWNNLLSFINTSILMTKDKNRGRNWIFEIFLQRFRTFQVLWFFHYHNPFLGHHWKSLGRIHDLWGRNIRAKHYSLIEITLFRLQHIICNIIWNLINVIGFFAHQYIYRWKITCFQVTHYRFIRCSCIFLFRHPDILFLLFIFAKNRQ